jgi:hypothetical protein
MVLIGEQVPGEDPFLAGEYAMNFISAFQGEGESRYLKAISTAKHFATYDLEGNWETDRTEFNAVVTLQDQVGVTLCTHRSLMLTSVVWSWAGRVLPARLPGRGSGRPRSEHDVRAGPRRLLLAPTLRRLKGHTCG